MYCSYFAQRLLNRGVIACCSMGAKIFEGDLLSMPDTHFFSRANEPKWPQQAAVAMGRLGFDVPGTFDVVATNMPVSSPCLWRLNTCAQVNAERCLHWAGDHSPSVDNCQFRSRLSLRYCALLNWTSGIGNMDQLCQHTYAVVLQLSPSAVFIAHRFDIQQQ